MRFRIHGITHEPNDPDRKGQKASATVRIGVGRSQFDVFAVHTRDFPGREGRVQWFVQDVASGDHVVQNDSLQKALHALTMLVSWNGEAKV